MLDILTGLAIGFGDLIAVASAIGSGVLVLNAFTPAKKLGKATEASYLGLLIGVLGQYAIWKTNYPVEISTFLKLSFSQINNLLLLSFLLLALRWYIKRNRYEFT